MTKKSSSNKKQTNIKVGNISNVRGAVNIAAGNITTNKNASSLTAGDIRQLFNELYGAINKRSDTSTADKEDLKSEVSEIQTTVTEAIKESKTIDEGFLAQRFRNIARMAPDILDVIVATLANPLVGLGVAVKKIADKAKKDVGK